MPSVDFKNFCLLHIPQRIDGPINVDEALTQIQYLNKTAPENISFVDYKYINELSVYDGVCSAHTLNFLSTLLRSWATEPFTGIEYKNFEDRVVKCLTNRPTDTQILTSQAALNAIEGDRYFSIFTDEFMENKIRAICNLKDLRIIWASPNNIHFKGQSDELNKRNFNSTFKNMKYGAYLIRGIYRTNNMKGEHYGHSMAFIKTDKACYFFDPSGDGGLLTLSNENAKDLLYDLVKSLCLHFYLDFPRFYELSPYIWREKNKNDAQKVHSK